MNALLAALAFLTRLPVPAPAPPDGGDFARAVRLYPLAGLAIGAVVAVAGRAGALVDPWVGAVAALGAWVWVTGALHLDGLADLTDGLGAAHGQRDRLLAVMADPHLGGFGVVAIVLQLLAKLVLLHLVPPAGWLALPLVPAAARIGPLAWAAMLPPLKPDGLGAAIAGSVRPRDLIGWGAVLAAAALAAPTVLVAAPTVLLFARWAHARVGGLTGDVHGAGIELTELTLLAAFVVL